MKRPMRENSQRDDGMNSNRFYHLTKCLSVIQPRLLIKSLNHKTSLTAFKGAVVTSFGLKGPFGTKDIIGRGIKD